MRVEPINCFRPAPERAGQFSSPPYDVFDDAQARAYDAEQPVLPVEEGEQQSKECKKIEEGKNKEKENIRNFI